MRTSIIKTIFKKEITEILRDKRMLYLLILLPFFLYPTLFTLMGSVGASQQEKIVQEELTLWASPNLEGSSAAQLLASQEHLTVDYRSFTETEVQANSKTIGLVSTGNFDEQLAQGNSAQLNFLIDESNDILKMRAGLLRQQFTVLSEQLLQQRLSEQKLSANFIEPIALTSTDISPTEGGGGMLASFLPMMILLFIFTGCIYIAIDITAGEKERRTLQTLFTTPTATSEIVAGKFLAVASVGIISAAMNILSLFVAMRLQAYLLGSSDSMGLSLAPDAWLWLIVLVLLATLFLAALCLAVILLANTYKEAQSYVSPLMMIVLIPAIMASMPGIELNYQTALIPVFNVALAIVALVKGAYDPAILGLVAVVSLVAGLLALYFASLTFGNENIITGEKVNWKDLLSGK